MIGLCFKCGKVSKWACDHMDCRNEMCDEHAVAEFGEWPPKSPQFYTVCKDHEEFRAETILKKLVQA